MTFDSRSCSYYMMDLSPSHLSHSWYPRRSFSHHTWPCQHSSRLCQHSDLFCELFAWRCKKTLIALTVWSNSLKHVTLHFLLTLAILLNSLKVLWLTAIKRLDTFPINFYIEMQYGEICKRIYGIYMYIRVLTVPVYYANWGIKDVRMWYGDFGPMQCNVRTYTKVGRLPWSMKQQVFK